MTGLLAFLSRRAAVILAAGVFAGLALPDLAALLRPFLAASVWGLLVLAMLRIEWADIREHGRRPVAVAAVVVSLLAISPACLWLVTEAADAPPGIAAALVLMAAAPPIMSSPALALLIGLDASLAMVVMVAATLVTPVVLPVIAIEFLGVPLDVGIVWFMTRLGALLASALCAALIARWLIGRQRLRRNAELVDGIAVVLLLVFAVAIMDGVTARLIEEPGYIALIIAVAFAANLGLQGLGVVIFAWQRRRPALTAAFCSGNRNMALLLAVLPADADPDIALYFALAQLPIYVLPACLAPIYRRWLAAG